MARDDNGKDGAATAPEVVYLKRLVTGLALVMGAGMIAIVILLWVRLGQAPLPELPPGLDLPEGAEAAAITFARDRILVLTGADELLVYDRSGALRGRVTLTP